MPIGGEIGFVNPCIPNGWRLGRRFPKPQVACSSQAGDTIAFFLTNVNGAACGIVAFPFGSFGPAVKRPLGGCRGCPDDAAKIRRKWFHSRILAIHRCSALYEWKKQFPENSCKQDCKAKIRCGHRLARTQGGHGSESRTGGIKAELGFQDIS